MTIQKLKEQLYSFLPKNSQIFLKNFYYDYIIFPIYFLKYRFYYGYWDFFDAIAIETTTYCNLRCEFCPNKKYERGLLKNKKLMDINLFKKIINELSEINYHGQILLHFYGEPLTDERLPDLVKYTKEKLPNSIIQINTNGFLLTIPLYKELIISGVSRFLITQYSKETPLTIKKFFEYIKKNPSDKIKIIYRRLGKDLGLSNRGGEIKVKKCSDFERPICLYPNNSIIIDYGGNWVLCCNDYHSSIKFGNLKNEKLLDIWNKPSYKRLREEIRQRNFKLPICKRCIGLIQNTT